MQSLRRVVGGCAAIALVLLGCSSPGPEPTASPSGQPSPTATGEPTPTREPSPTSTPTPAPTPTGEPTRPAAPDLSDWSVEQQVGQLFMVGVDVRSQQSASYAAVRDHHVGNVFLAGRSHATPDAVGELVDSFTALVDDSTTRSTPLFVATDQEGGQVQVLQGPGFSAIPSAMEQADLSPATLQARAETWGTELAAAGVNLNLAPVMDVVTNATTARTNAPIGAFDRNYGFGEHSTTRAANAFSSGMRAAGVEVAIKHFPGLGRVGHNTDTDADVVDEVTTRDDSSVAAFRSGIEAGAPVVMVSSAVYAKIDDAAPAAFSRVVITDLLRGDLGFDGVVISDDLSAAVAVQSWTPAQRAIDFIAAGGDIVLASEDPTVIEEMVSAVVEAARSDPDFAHQVETAVGRVLAAKAGL